MTLQTARNQVRSQLLAAGLTEPEARAALAALIVAGPLAEDVPEWIPSAFAARATYPAADIVAEITRLRSATRATRLRARETPRPSV
jgi:hypothetical protein